MAILCYADRRCGTGAVRRTAVASCVQFWCLPYVIFHLTSILSEVLISTGHTERIIRIDLTLATTSIVLAGLAALVSVELVILSFVVIGLMRVTFHRKNMRDILGVGFSDLESVLLTSGMPVLVTAAARLTMCGAEQADITAPPVRLTLSIFACGLATTLAIYATRQLLHQEITQLVSHLLKPDNLQVPSQVTEGLDSPASLVTYGIPNADHCSA